MCSLGNSEESSPVLEAYGSFVMDMYSSQSDLDVSINFGNGTSEIPREKKLEILKRFAKKLRSLQGKIFVPFLLLLRCMPIPLLFSIYTKNPNSLFLVYR